MRADTFELDMGGRRLSHLASGDTALRHPWMIQDREGVDRWRERLLAFAAAHPDVHVVLNAKGDVIDDFRRWPCNGGGFEVGETVVTLSRFGEPLVAREVVARVRVPPEHVDAGRHDLDHSFLLDDGTTLRWSSDEDCWTAHDLDGARVGRTRPPAPTDRLDLLVPSSDRLVEAACAKLRAAFREVGGEPRSHLRGLLEPVHATAMVVHERALECVRSEAAKGGCSLTEAVTALRDAADWIEEGRRARAFVRNPNHPEQLGVRSARTVADTIERRLRAEATPNP